MIKDPDDKVKYLEKYTSNINSDKYELYGKSSQSRSRKRNKIQIIDEEDAFRQTNSKEDVNRQFDHTEESPKNKDTLNLWQEYNEEDNEDELKAIENAKKEIDYISEYSEDENLSGKKRQRHDSESEEERERHDTEDELDELIQDEEGDLILENIKQKTPVQEAEKKGGLVFEIKEKKEVKKDDVIGKQLLEKMKKQTVYRDELGRKVEKNQTKEARKKELRKLNYENLEKWAKGLKQKEEEMARREEYIRAKNEPFARHDMDEQHEQELRDQTRFGDPMKQLIFKNDFDKGISKSASASVNRGFYLPKSKFAGFPNRFGIEPGYRWDGVDRGTGFEYRYLEAINVRNAREQEYHKLRTEEM